MAAVRNFHLAFTLIEKTNGVLKLEMGHFVRS